MNAYVQGFLWLKLQVNLFLWNPRRVRYTNEFEENSKIVSDTKIKMRPKNSNNYTEKNMHWVTYCPDLITKRCGMHLIITIMIITLFIVITATITFTTSFQNGKRTRAQNKVQYIRECNNCGTLLHRSQCSAQNVNKKNRFIFRSLTIRTFSFIIQMSYRFSLHDKTFMIFLYSPRQKLRTYIAFGLRMNDDKSGLMMQSQR